MFDDQFHNSDMYPSADFSEPRLRETICSIEDTQRAILVIQLTQARALEIEASNPETSDDLFIAAERLAELVRPHAIYYGINLDTVINPWNRDLNDLPPPKTKQDLRLIKDLINLETMLIIRQLNKDTVCPEDIDKANIRVRRVAIMLHYLTRAGVAQPQTIITKALRRFRSDIPLDRLRPYDPHWMVEG